MNKSLFLILGLILSTVVRAESATDMTPPEAMPADVTSNEAMMDPEMDNNNDFYEGRFVLEANTRINGSINGTYDNSPTSKSYRSSSSWTTGLGFSLSGRYFVNHEQAFTFSIPVSAVNTNDKVDSSRADIYLLPLLFGYRYQFSNVGNSRIFRPYAQAEFGLVFTQALYYSQTESSTQSSTVAKPSVGMDIYLSNRSPLYFGVQTGYLFVKDHSNSEFALNLGTQL